ncbi:N,N-dimethylformamidase beta subunit family domain-containing protein [Pseudonocardia bannensis]|uniref:N,N-dimethylformamidase beta subunit-like C-terminal domain-containing protein n=1 Tax=Pseudonocardia bannensis TaxID=630973 RepID=A0A848DTJ4_9PSEU|nr:N,N-dimethylformamidase beta subunit family domain-containing protein [Pseudonocardia bannensis]NMH95524.1 hypothetical protein [Pseudonocardia bannensis]
MIYGYPDRPGLGPGEELMLRVSTDAPAFRVEFYRCGANLTFVARSPWLDGHDVPHHLPHQDWGRPGTGPDGRELPGWPGYRFPIPPDWAPGVHLAVFVEAGAPHLVPRTPDARDSTALFVLRNRPGGAGRILYKLPLLTYHAYNEVVALPRDAPRHRAWCLYTGDGVAVRRPGGGTGGTPWDIFNADPHDPTPRQTFVHWDAPFLAWLERTGYRVDHCTDLDLHRDPTLLDSYRLLVSAGHDEYWSDAMRANVERFRDGGGNVAFFGGNTCWWRVRFDPGADAVTYVRVQNWHDGPGRPENRLTGVSFRNGGERPFDARPVPVGYRVQHADHWVYAGTGLGDGDTFGDRRDEYLVGYECDGAHFDRTDLARGRPVRASGDDGTPPGFTILGVGDVGAAGWGLGNRAATMGTYARGGTVFTAATTDWPRVLASGTTPAVERITRNVLDRLG